MQKKAPCKTVYYTDELNDDFAGTNIKKQVVDGNFKYVRKNPLWKACSFFVYYVIAVPVVWFIEKVIFRVRFVNKKAVKKYRKTPYFLYGNHTGFIDAFTPNLISFPRRNRIIVSSDTVSIKGIKNLTQMLGAVPVPTGASGMKNFLKAIETHHKKCNITVFPEAHIWPYYTGVRSFTDTSFSYPAKYFAPTFAFFTAYTPPKGFLAPFRKTNVTVYISDAIFPDEGLPLKERKKNVRDKVYAFMLEKSKLSTYKVIDYVKKEG